jgi:hypothetical protein
MNSRNERGYVLISVLALIILVMAFGMLLISKNLNTAIQVNKTERSTHAKDLSEMGIHYANAYLQSLITGAIDATKNSNPLPENQDKVFCGQFINRLKVPHIKDGRFGGNLDHNFKVDYQGIFDISATRYNTVTKIYEPYSVKSTDPYDCSGFLGVKVPLISTGKKGNEERNINAVFTIENKGKAGNRFEPGTTYANLINPDNGITYENTYDTDPKLSGQSKLDLPADVKFNNIVTISGNGKLYIGGHAYFNGLDSKGLSVNLNGQEVIVAISGNAYFKNGVDYKASNYICIRGSTYKWDYTTNKWVIFSIKQQSSQTDPCPENIAKTILYLNDLTEWGVIEGELNLIY